jgi:hypothetical protein
MKKDESYPPLQKPDLSKRPDWISEVMWEQMIESKAICPGCGVMFSDNFHHRDCPETKEEEEKDDKGEEQ